MSTLEKAIREHQQETLIETTNAFKSIEQLVRMGLMPVEQLPFLKRALVQMESGAFMPAPERRSFYTFINKLLEVTLSDPAILRQVKNKTASLKNEEAIVEDCHSTKPLENFDDKVSPNTWAPGTADAVAPTDPMAEGHCKACGLLKKAVAGLAGTHCLTCDKVMLATAVRDFAAYPIGHHEEAVNEAIDLKKTPPGMLQTLANIVKQKKRAGGKPTPEDKKMATRAKNELRRRRHMGEEVEQIDELSKKTLEKYTEKSRQHVMLTHEKAMKRIRGQNTAKDLLKKKVSEATEQVEEAVQTITKKDWNAKHKDHKHTIGRNKYLMVLDKKTGGTMLKPVAVVENYEAAVAQTLAEFGVSSIAEVEDTKAFFAMVEAAVEDWREKAKQDMEKHKAKKAKALEDAKTELDNTDKKELKKSYIQHAFKKKDKDDVTESEDWREKAKQDMAKRKAEKEKVMADAKKELDATDKKELKKSYIKHAFKKEND